MHQVEERLHALQEGRIAQGGVLTEIWNAHEELPVLSRSELVRQMFANGLHTVLSRRSNSVIAIATIAVALSLVAGLFVISKNLNLLIASSADALTSSVVFIRKGVPKPVIEQIAAQLRSLEHVEKVAVVHEAEAMNEFRRELGSRSQLIEALGDENPLPASIEVESGSAATAEQLSQILAKNANVEEIISSGDWAARFRGFVRFIEFVSWSVGVAVFLGAAFLIANTMRLVIFGRRDELAIMKLVGATDSFIRIPFLIAGGIKGALGAALAIMLTGLGTIYVRGQLGRSELFGYTIPQPQFLSVGEALLFLGCGLALGALASRFATSRFLDV